MTQSIEAGKFKPPPCDVANSNPAALTVTDTLLEHYAAWFTAMRMQVESLEITYEEVDSICGLADGQYEKLVRKGNWTKGQRRAGPYVMFAMTNNLGFDLVLRVNPEKLANLRELMTKRKRPKRMRGLGAHERGHEAPRDLVIKFGADQLRLNGAKGAQGYLRKVSPAKRRRNARKAALVRWGDVKEAANNGLKREKENASQSKATR